MVDEVLQQLRSLLYPTNEGGTKTAHDHAYLTATNPYATIRRGSMPGKGSNKLSRHSVTERTLTSYPVNRSISMPGSRPLNMLPEPPPPYSVSAPSHDRSIQYAASMMNLNPKPQPPPVGPSHANSTRQLLHAWKEASTDHTPSAPNKSNSKKTPSAMRQYVSSPDLSPQEYQYTSEVNHSTLQD